MTLTELLLAEIKTYLAEISGLDNNRLQDGDPDCNHDYTEVIDSSNDHDGDEEWWIEECQECNLSWYMP
jgi:hypothetical protein